MLFADFADVYDAIASMTSLNEINRRINDFAGDKSELYAWLYLVSTFDGKFRVNDRHLLTVFSKLREPHIDRKNLQDAFRAQGVARTCAAVAKLDDAMPSSLNMNDVYLFLQTLQELPSKSAFLLRHFQDILPRCDEKTLRCLINLIRNTNKTRRSMTKKRKLYLFRQVFGRGGFEKADVLSDDLKSERHVLKNMNVIRPGQPVEPMLAQPCKSFDVICFEEMCVEIKHDGERVQLHKMDNKIVCYKRNLNVNQRCETLADSIRCALRSVESVVLDCELIGSGPDTYQLVVFDVLYLDGRCLTHEKLKTRRNVLNLIVEENDRITLIESVVSEDRETVEMWVKSLLGSDKIEGVVIKNWNGIYEPKKKKWFKVKRSYFNNVCSADLVVVGGWEGEKRITVYLVATPFYDHKLEQWMFLPVSKVKFSKNNYEQYMEPYDPEKCDWLVVDQRLRSLGKIPDMVAKDPTSMPVWEMEGDFIRSDDVWRWNDISRNYVSIRLPRFIRVRDDKDYRQASTIFDLQLLSTITDNTFRYRELYEFYLADHIKNYVPQ